MSVPHDIAVPVVTDPGSSGEVSTSDEEEGGEMAGNGSEYGDADRPGRKNVLVWTVAIVIVGALAAAAAWYVMNERQGERKATAQAAIERQIQLEEETAERARLDADQAAVLAVQLEAKAAAEEAARLEAVRLAELAAAEEAARQAELERQIAETRAALEREQAAVETAAREAAEAAAAERERILAEQERRRREAIAAEEARAIEIAFNMAREVNLFVSKWVRALDEQDYSLYQELGFRESESEFLQLYGDDAAEYQIAVSEKKQWEGGFVSLRVTETYDPPGSGPGLELREIERRLVLRPTASGMRYAGDRK